MARQAVIILFILFIFSGCGISEVMYNSKGNSSLKDIQEVTHEKCAYFIGPFNASKSFSVEDAVKEAVEKGNENGYFGDELVNVKVEETGFTGIVFSRYCVKVQGNLSYSNMK